MRKCVCVCIYHISKEHRRSVDDPEKMLLLNLISITLTNAQLGYSSRSPLHHGIMCVCLCVCVYHTLFLFQC